MVALVVTITIAQPAQAQKLFPFIFPEERTVRVRDPSELAHVPIPKTAPPPTVSSMDKLALRPLTLDEAIHRQRNSQKNTQVVPIQCGQFFIHYVPNLGNF